MERHKYTVDQLKNAVKVSRSIREVLQKLGIVPAGGNYATIKKRIKKYNIDISHFGGQSWNKGKVIGPKKPIEFYLKKDTTVQSYKLKHRLIDEGIFQHKCQNCNLSSWLDKSIPLELHHKDGDHDNNELSNLAILCPNCHALTDNYRGKNK